MRDHKAGQEFLKGAVTQATDQTCALIILPVAQQHPHLIKPWDTEEDPQKEFKSKRDLNSDAALDLPRHAANGLNHLVTVKSHCPP